MLNARERWRDVPIPGAMVPALLPPVGLAGVTARMDAVPALGEHTDTYPEALIGQMRQLGIFGLAVPEEYGGTPVSPPTTS